MSSSIARRHPARCISLASDERAQPVAVAVDQATVGVDAQRRAPDEHVAGRACRPTRRGRRRRGRPPTDHRRRSAGGSGARPRRLRLMRQSRPHCPTVAEPSLSITNDAAPSTSGRWVHPSRKKPPRASRIGKPLLNAATSASALLHRHVGGLLPRARLVPRDPDAARTGRASGPSRPVRRARSCARRPGGPGSRTSSGCRRPVDRPASHRPSFGTGMRGRRGDVVRTARVRRPWWPSSPSSCLPRSRRRDGRDGCVGLPPFRGGCVEYHQCCTPSTTVPRPWSRNHSTAFSDGLRLPGAPTWPPRTTNRAAPGARR